MGVNSNVSISTLGFYPAGGGKWQIVIEPTQALKPIHLTDAGCDFASDMNNCSLNALISLLPASIGQREITKAQEILDWQDALSQVQEVTTPGPGNSFQLSIDSKTHCNVFEVVGELGVSAERVARRAAGRVNKFIHAKVAVEEHLADQLLLLIALAGSGSFTTTKPSLHTTTNIAVIKQMLGKEISVNQLTDTLWRVSLE